jgi:hypothetical protein
LKLAEDSVAAGSEMRWLQDQQPGTADEEIHQIVLM